MIVPAINSVFGAERSGLPDVSNLLGQAGLLDGFAFRD
jgi:hypothetical protein